MYLLCLYFKYRKFEIYYIIIIEVATFWQPKAVFASGSPFLASKGFGLWTYEPGQVNNAYIFYGASLGVICTDIHHISDSVFLSAAECLADMVQDSDIITM